MSSLHVSYALSFQFSLTCITHPATGRHVPKYILPRGMQVADLNRKRKRRRNKHRSDGMRRTDNDPRHPGSRRLIHATQVHDQAGEGIGSGVVSVELSSCRVVSSHAHSIVGHHSPPIVTNTLSKFLSSCILRELVGWCRSKSRRAEL